MKPMTTKSRPDIRALTRLVPSGGNLVQGQSELAINPALAEAASQFIAASKNHYSPTGKVFARSELGTIASVCQEFDLLCISDEVYEHYVVGEQPHMSIATLPGMWERTITVNSFSKSWNISGCRLGYVYGDGPVVSPLNKANNVFYVCSPTPLQRALAEVLMVDPQYYIQLRESFTAKRKFAVQAVEQVGFEVYDSGSAFYLWARIPRAFEDAMQLNEMLINRAGVAGVPGSAFADSNDWNNYIRLSIVREDEVLHGAFDRLQSALC